MDDIFNKILSEYKEPIDPITLVIIYRNKETLNSFQEQYFSDDNNTIKIDNDTLFMTYNCIKIDGKEVYLHSCICDDKGLDWVAPIQRLFNGLRKENIRWLILLDWSIYDQQLWFEHIEECLKQLKDYSTKTVLCMNSEYIYEIQKNVPSWYSYHIDYIQQALRWYCLNHNCNLIYTGSKQDNFCELLRKYLTNEFEAEDVEMAKTTKLLIPHGYDSLNLIKTVDDTFNADECSVAKFREVVPAPVNQNTSIDSMISESEHFTISDANSNIPDPQQLDSFDVQKQLTELNDYFRTLNK